MKGQKFGNPRGKICRWTLLELDEILKSAWARGGLRSVRRAIRQQQPTWSWYSIKKRAAFLELYRPKARPAQIQYWIAEGLLTKVGALPHSLPRLRHDAIRWCNPAGGFLLRLEVIRRCGAPRWSVPRNKTFSNLGLSECLLPYRGPLRQGTRQRV
jgi:hypothetical protein